MNDTPDGKIDMPAMLCGRIVDVSGLAYVSDVEVGLAGVRPNGEKVHVVVRTSDIGGFEILLPAGPFVAARAATGIDGPAPIELDIEDGEIVPGEVVFTMPPEASTHLRFGFA